MAISVEEMAMLRTSPFTTASNYQSPQQTDINMQQDMPRNPSSGRDQPLDIWLPITQSRNGNAFTAACHLLCSGIGIQTVALPVAFIYLGWFWGILCLSIAFAWQLYTSWLLIHLHQPRRSGPRYSRYVVLSIVAFGPKLGKLLAIFPTSYLSGSTCVLFVLRGGEIMKHLHQILHGNDPNYSSHKITGVEWLLIFVSLAIFISLLFPTLNSLTVVSLLGAISAMLYTTLLWCLSLSKGRPDGSSYNSMEEKTPEKKEFVNIMMAIDFIALVFRGHNVILEIQGTLPTEEPGISRRHMKKAMFASYLLIAAFLYPLAAVGHWAYGNMMDMDHSGILTATAYTKFHKNDTSKSLMATIHLAIILHHLCAYQIYAMPFCDNVENIVYVSKKKQACPKLLKAAIKVFFGGTVYLLSVALPLLSQLGPLVGAIALPVTFAYPCFMWIALNKPKPMSLSWCFNGALGLLGILMSSLLFAGALWYIVVRGLDANFFRPLNENG